MEKRPRGRPKKEKPPKIKRPRGRPMGYSPIRARGRPPGAANKTPLVKMIMKNPDRFEDVPIMDGHLRTPYISLYDFHWAMEKLKELALDVTFDDRVEALKIFTSFTPPGTKSRLLTMPDLVKLRTRDPKDVLDYLDNIRTMIALGRLTLEEAEILNRIVMDSLKVWQMTELQTRVERLEAEQDEVTILPSK